jgi:hypothetical protein
MTSFQVLKRSAISRATGRGEPLLRAFAFAYSGRLVGVLGSIVQLLRLAVLDRTHNTATRCPIAAERVSDHQPRYHLFPGRGRRRRSPLA